MILLILLVNDDDCEMFDFGISNVYFTDKGQLSSLLKV